MSTGTRQVIEDFIDAELKSSEDVFLVELKITPGNDIKVFLDADNGITIEKCTKLNRALYKHMEETAMFPDNNFSLEVSSPGIDEPLKLNRQYLKNIGRKVEVTLTDETKKEGKLIAVTQDEITMEERTGTGKKLKTQTTNILFNQIKHTVVLVTF